MGLHFIHCSKRLLKAANIMNENGIGIYCTVCSSELCISLATLEQALYSEAIKKIIILVTDSIFDGVYGLSDKISIHFRNFGKGYNISLTDGGYDQISARNYALDLLDAEKIQWVMMHDADDFYEHTFFDFIIKNHTNDDAITCSCFSMIDKKTLGVPPSKLFIADGMNIYDPHTRIWKKSLNLRYEKSKGIEKYFSNHSRHCGVKFPHSTIFGFTDKPWHFHLHAIFNKRNSHEIKNFALCDVKIPYSLRKFIEINEHVFE